ncbi:LysE family translocator [candidate division KSB3 bacterium]|uniref:LysE family translocator n=1 Tax=candidate division KSB3 bacterium TaxID=2044937 RepID=A0A9D5JVH3_9BACT|nr:LysE family translocator [candidate division KSB3 bacterium]
MQVDVSLLISALVLGLPAGFSPGPLQTLIISQTLRHSTKEGMLVAFAPLLSDLPIVLFTFIVLSQVSDVDVLMGVISLVGAGFIMYLGYGNLRVRGIEAADAGVKPASVRKGVLTNFLNPYPYLFWLFIGAPIVLEAYQDNVVSAGLFLGIFYFCLVGAHVLIAFVTGKSRSFLKGKVYRYAIRSLGVLLMVFSLRFLWNALKFFGVVG